MEISLSNPSRTKKRMKMKNSSLLIVCTNTLDLALSNVPHICADFWVVIALITSLMFAVQWSERQDSFPLVV